MTKYNERHTNMKVDKTIWVNSDDKVDIAGIHGGGDSVVKLYMGSTSSSPRRDGICVFNTSRKGDQNTQKFFDMNDVGSSYNSWDAFTGAAASEHTIIFNIDAKRINTAATAAVTDRGLNITVENQTDSSGGTLDLVGTHIKASNDGGQLQDLKVAHFEIDSSATNTIAGDSDILQLQASGSVAGNTTGDTSCIKFTGNDNTDFAFNFEATSGCVGTGSGMSQGGNIDGYIKLQIGSNTLYVNAYDSSPS